MSAIPADWYPDPVHQVGLRYWNGDAWTEYVSVSGQMYTSPLPEAKAVAKKKIYWSNLFRLRFWTFTIFGPLVLTYLLSLILPASMTSFVLLFLILSIGYFWLHQQMACEYCRTSLRVTRLDGGQKVCHKCGQPTDN